MVRQNVFTPDINLGIIIPTYNRPEAIEVLLQHSARKFYALNIDIIIFDSSNNDKVKSITYNYILEGCSNIKYVRCMEDFDDFSLGYRVASALKLYCDKYEYIWICCERFIINICECYDYLVKCFKKKPDYIIVDSKFRCETNEDFIKEYRQCDVFCKEQFQRMTIMGTIILKGTIAKNLVEKYPVDDLNCSLWLCRILFQDISKTKFLAVFLCSDVFYCNYANPDDIFWNRSKQALKQWEDYYFAVRNLPDIYKNIKKYLYNINLYDFHPFRILSLLRIRGNHGVSIKYIKRYKMSLKGLGVKSFWKLYLIALIPPFIANYLVENENKMFIKAMIEFYRLCVQDIDYEE